MIGQQQREAHVVIRALSGTLYEDDRDYGAACRVVNRLYSQGLLTGIPLSEDEAEMLNTKNARAYRQELFARLAEQRQSEIEQSLGEVS